MALTKDGRIYGWGMNNYRQVYVSCCSEYVEIMKPKRIKFCFLNPKQSFKQIVCGFGYSIALNEGNEIIGWGNNCFGQIGNGRIKNYELGSKIISNNDDKRKEKIKSIVCGSFHSLALFDDGDVYGWGNDTVGQLGLVPDKNRIRPYRMFSKIKQIESVNLHTLALTFDGILYLMGDNSYGQLGHEVKTYHSVPIIIDMQFTQIATISGLSMGMKEDGKFYIWGLCGGKIITKPTKVEYRSFDNIVAVFVGLTYKTLKITKEQNMQEIELIEPTLTPDNDDKTEGDTSYSRLNEHEKKLTY